MGVMISIDNSYVMKPWTYILASLLDGEYDGCGVLCPILVGQLGLAAKFGTLSDPCLFVSFGLLLIGILIGNKTVVLRKCFPEFCHLSELPNLRGSWELLNCSTLEVQVTWGPLNLQLAHEVREVFLGTVSLDLWRVC